MLSTVGHGTASAEELAVLLAGAGITAIVDVRRFPGSRRHPHVARDELARWLPAAGVAYRWEERLGGRRSRDPASPNTGLRNASFQGYADHMRSADFRAALDQLLADAATRPTAILCSEALWWRCHRRLVADAVVLLHEVPVTHLLHDGRTAPHVVTDVARRAGDHVVYGGAVQGELPL